MGLFESAYEKYITKPLADYLVEKAKSDPSYFGKANAPGSPVLREQVQHSRLSPPGTQRQGAGVSWKALRRLSIQYDVARACINRRKRQINGLDWDIVPTRKDDDNEYVKEREAVRETFKSIGGYKVRMRKFFDLIIEDLLVLDAVSIYKRPTMNGKLHSLQVIDSATIKLIVGEDGGTPMPPETAYEQHIRGKKVADFTADEMYYEHLNPRTDTPYGLSPLESMVIGVSSALKSDLYNLHMLTEGNIPEGFFGVPESWNPDQIKQFQAMFDAMLAGDTNATNKLKFMPDGKYQPTVKPEDMRYKEMQEWLMKKTCMLFEIQPQELGFTETVNRSTGEVQQEISLNSGLLPLASFVSEILTDVVQEDLGYSNLKFKFLGLEHEDALENAKVAEIQIRSGQTTVDEVRTARGMKPVGVDKPFVMGNPTFIDAESVESERQAKADAEARAAAALNAETEEPEKKEDEETNDNKNDQEENQTAKASSADRHVELVTELRTFRKYAVNRLKAGKALRPFESKILPAPAVDEMNRRLSKVASVDEAKEVFSEYMQDYQVEFLSDVAELNKIMAEARNE